LKSISPLELKQYLDSGKEIQVIDIREDHERVLASIQSIHIPMEYVLSSIERIRTDVPVVIHCQSGQRAAAVIYALEKKYSLSNLHNLEGGIVAWREEFPLQTA
jgi:adenylyltransferase/sulfurtransferase